MGYSKQDLVKFLIYVREKNLVKYQTATSWNTAVSKLMSDLSEAEDTDVRKVDIELAAHRVANRESGSIAPSSLKAYQKRARRAVEEFVSWRDDPVNYRPRNFGNSKQTTTGNSTRKKKDASTKNQQHAKSAVDKVIEEAVSPVQSSGLNLSYPLRPDFLAQIVVPRDLSQLEAKRLGAFILTLSSDYQPD